MVKYLLELEANTSLFNRNNKTPLDLANDSLEHLKAAETKKLLPGKKLPEKAVKGSLQDRLEVTISTLKKLLSPSDAK